MHSVLSELRAELRIASVSRYRPDSIGRVDGTDSALHLVLVLRILFNRSLQKVSDVVIDQIARAIALLYLSDLLVGVDKAFFSTLSNNNETVTLGAHPLNDLIVEAVWPL